MAITVLIVDDDEQFRRVVNDLLKARPEVNVVGEAGDGVAACRLAGSLRSDIVLMDLAMPHMNGLQATRRIKADRPDTKVIIVSLYGEENGYQKAAEESGADALLSKRSLALTLLPTIKALAGEGRV